MRGRIGTASHLYYARPYWGKTIYKLSHINQLSPKAKARYKAMNLYRSGDYSARQICEIFEINRSTFYRWRKKYDSHQVQSLENRFKKPHQLRMKVARNPHVETLVCQVRRKYPYFDLPPIIRTLS